MTVCVLASASPARATLLRNAGIEPVIKVSGVDEDVITSWFPDATPGQLALNLARTKCETIAERGGFDRDAVVVGCDSLFEIDGQALGKPASAEEAISRWKTMRGRTGVLHTGHWVYRTSGEPRGLGDVVSTSVTFAEVSDKEIAAYVATGEPLHVAGAFTLDSLGGPFVERIDGDALSVIGLSLALMRRLAIELDVPWTSLWNAPMK